MSKFSEGFNKGYCQLQAGMKKKVRDELMIAMKVNNLNSVSQKKHGKQSCSAWQIDAINEVFAKYGITEVWGKYDE